MKIFAIYFLLFETAYGNLICQGPAEMRTYFSPKVIYEFYNYDDVTIFNFEVEIDICLVTIEFKGLEIRNNDKGEFVLLIIVINDFYF